MNTQKFYRGKRVQPQMKRKPWHQFLPILGVVALVATMIWIASKYHSFVNLGYEITDLRDTNQTLKVEQDKLLAELERLQRPDRVMGEMLAMGLQRVPTNRRYAIYVEPPADRDQPAREGETLVAFSEMTSP